MTTRVGNDQADVLGDRCDRLGGAVVELMKALLEAQGAPQKSARALPLVGRVRAVADLGTEGVDDATYRRWETGASGNLDAIEEALRVDDADGAWRAFSDQEAGVVLLATACAGRPGW